MRIAFVDNVHPLLAERLQSAGHSCVFLDALDSEALPEALHDIEGIVVRSRRLPSSVLSQAPKLRFVARVGSGLENIDRVHCEERGVLVLNSPEGNRDGVGEWCVAQTLVLLKHLYRANEQVHQGIWKREDNRGSDLAGKTVGIIGYGNMGSAFAAKLQGFGVEILAHDKYKKGFATEHVAEVSLENLLQRSDIVSLHLPLDHGTHHYANEAFFAALKKPIWFLNASRGPVLHTAALLKALDSGHVLGAALDVLEFERADLSGLEPGTDITAWERLRAHPSVLLSPHIAGVTHEGKVKMAQVLADKILNAFPNEG